MFREVILSAFFCVGLSQAAPAETPAETQTPGLSSILSGIQNFPGKCPAIPAQADFDLNKWAASPWYMVFASDRVHWNDSMKCVEKVYTPPLENDDKLSVESYFVLNRVPVWKTSSLQVLKDSPGTFRHIFPENVPAFARLKNVDFSIVQTDYDNYALGWGCWNDDEADRHYVSAGISSRRRELPKETFDQISAFLKDNNSEIKFEPVDFYDCRARCQ